jgi:PmbA protein
MNGREEFIKMIEKAVSEAPADEIEILAFRSEGGLTRVANSQIHQNVTEANSAISVRAIVDKRIGTANTNRPDPDAIADAVEKAVANAQVSPRVDDWPGLPTNPRTIDDRSFESTRNCTPGKRAELVEEALTIAKNNKLTMAGALETGITEIFVANTHSPVSVSVSTDIKANMVLMALDSSGYAAWVGRDLTELDMAGLARIAAEKAEASRKPGNLEPGQYTVILEPAAVADMLSFLGYVGLGALSVQEKRSFICGHFGEQLVDEKVTLWDDGKDKRTLGPTFDFEGVPKQKVVFFDHGTASGVVYDTRTAAREGKNSTGHALPAPNPHGPLPLNIFLETGDTPIDEMIAQTERGIYITRFHYTNIEEPMRAVFTGMTRDGTFLIENGRLACGLKNLRFTQSIVDALNAVQAVGEKPALVDAFLGACHCPALMIRDFNITGISDV